MAKRMKSSVSPSSKCTNGHFDPCGTICEAAHRIVSEGPKAVQ